MVKFWSQIYKPWSPTNKIMFWLGIVGILSGLIFGGKYLIEFNNDNNVISNINSPNSVNIIGDNNTINPTVNLLEPKFELKYLSEGKQQSSISLNIVSQIPLQRIQIEINDPNIISFDIRKNSVVSSMQGIIQQNADGYASYSFENAFGQYILSINTEDQIQDIFSKIKISYQ